MRWTAYVSGVGLLLAAVVSVAPAQSPRYVTSGVPRSSGGTYYSPYSIPPAPGCATPGMPYGTPVVPHGSVLPGTVMPGTTMPGTVMPGTPMPSTPSAPGTNAPGAAAPGAAAPGATAPGMNAAAPGAGAGAAAGAAALGAGAGAAAAAAAADPAGAAGGERGSDALASAAPQMIGDLSSSGYAVVRRSSSSGSGSSSSTGPRIPIGARSGFKIAENESPRPQNRAFLTYNYFNNLGTFGGGRGDLHRGLAGFEYAFLDGSASVGMRVPFTQGEGAGAVGLDGFGDLSVLGKYAFYNDCNTGDVVSGGLVITAPTGYKTNVGGTSISSVLIQPWVGFVLSMEDVYALGFTGVVVPTDGLDVTLYTLDVGLGYRLYNAGGDAFLTSITPTVETHVNIPLSGNGPDSPIYFPDSVFLTGGLHFGICKSRLTLAAAIPITGPKLFDVEFAAQLNVSW